MDPTALAAACMEWRPHRARRNGRPTYVDDVFLTDEAGMLFFFDPDTSQSHTVPTKELNWRGFSSAETQQLGDALDAHEPIWRDRDLLHLPEMVYRRSVR